MLEKIKKRLEKMDVDTLDLSDLKLFTEIVITIDQHDQGVKLLEKFGDCKQIN